MSSIIALILSTKRRLLLAVCKLTVTLRVAHGLLIRRRTMEISFRGRGACTGRNNNLLTSHARNATRYLASAHAFELPLSLRPFGRPRSSAAARHRVRQPIVSAAIVIYRLDDLRFRLHRRQRRRRYRTVPGRPEVSERFISARSLVYPRWRQRDAPCPVLLLTVSPVPRILISFHITQTLRHPC